MPKIIKVIFHVDHRWDGNGDLGNVIDLTEAISNQLEAEDYKLEPYFVISSTEDGAPLKRRLKVSLSRLANVPDEHIYFFPWRELDNRKTRSQSHEFDLDGIPALLQSSAIFRSAYEKADAIFIVSTPFPGLHEALSGYIKPNVPVIEITEHYASSYEERKFTSSNRYVTGVGEKFSGLMVRDLEHPEPAAVLASIKDIPYLKKLGFQDAELPLTLARAQVFLNENLIIPVYLHNQGRILPSIMELLSHSHFSQKYKKIYFHLNGTAIGDMRDFGKTMDTLKRRIMSIPGYSHETLPHIPYECIFGHFFDDVEDYNKLFKLYPGQSVAVVAGDKTLELAISSGLFPLYIPPRHKLFGYESYVAFEENHGVNIAPLNRFLQNHLTHLNYRIFEESCNDSWRNSFLTPRLQSPVFRLLNQSLLQTWHEQCRTGLLQTSFYHVLHDQITSNIIKSYEATIVSTSSLTPPTAATASAAPGVPPTHSASSAPQTKPEVVPASSASVAISGSSMFGTNNPNLLSVSELEQKYKIYAGFFSAADTIFGKAGAKVDYETAIKNMQGRLKKDASGNVIPEGASYNALKDINRLPDSNNQVSMRVK